MIDKIYTNATIATMSDLKNTDGLSVPYGLMENAAIAIKDGNIHWLGNSADASQFDIDADNIIDVNGKLITPGLIDCHTHLVFGGSRAKEFEMRLTGVSYEEIARSGGGINSTVRATRAETEEQLYQSAVKRLTNLMQEGVTSVEIKSGYGLDTENEIKMLKVATRLKNEFPVNIKRTFLGAHALPPEFNNDADAYINYVCDEMLPKAVELDLVDHVDIFCENIGFTIEHADKLFEVAQKHNIPVKMHAGQLSDMKGPTLVSKYQGLSSDHIEYLSEDCIKTMADNNQTAVLLPGAFYTLRETKLPPIDMLRQYQIPIAVASDFNPGSSPLCSLRLMMHMACTLFRLTPEESLAGVTRNAAKAFGDKNLGTLEQGKKADLVVWDLQHPSELSYQFAANQVLFREFSSSFL